MYHCVYFFSISKLCSGWFLLHTAASPLKELFSSQSPAVHSKTHTPDSWITLRTFSDLILPDLLPYPRLCSTLHFKSYCPMNVIWQLHPQAFPLPQGTTPPYTTLNGSLDNSLSHLSWSPLSTGQVQKWPGQVRNGRLVHTNHRVGKLAGYFQAQVLKGGRFQDMGQTTVGGRM